MTNKSKAIVSLYTIRSIEEKCDIKDLVVMNFESVTLPTFGQIKACCT